MIQQLDDSITDELLAGARALPFADRHHFDHNLLDLLGKSLQFKKNWLLNVQAARKRYDRVHSTNAGLQAESRARSKLLKWMATGRAS
jgi:hypothetical protein